MVTRNASVLTYLIQFKYMQSCDLLSHVRCLEFQNELRKITSYQSVAKILASEQTAAISDSQRK